MLSDPRSAPPQTRLDPTRELRRVRHETRRRTLTVSAVETLTPHMRRIHLHSFELGDFASSSPDDHIKLFLPGPDGSEIKRDYTPRSFDVAAGTLAIDFALHEAGPATAWAMGAKPGDRLVIGGPRGSVIVPETFDWNLLIGDETTLPAIGRRLEEAQPGMRMISIGCVDQAQDIQTFDTAADWTCVWLCRDVDGADDLANVRRVLERLFPSSGAGFVWIAGEALFARALRAHVNERLGHPAEWTKASGYWVRDPADAEAEA
jgi:NADPH-dependent ferric siderophore reductase